MNFKNVDGPVDGRAQKCGFPPNFVHSLDASHMMMVATEMMRVTQPPTNAGEDSNRKFTSRALAAEEEGDFDMLRDCLGDDNPGGNSDIDVSHGLKDPSDPSGTRLIVDASGRPLSQTLFPALGPDCGQRTSFAAVHDSFWTHACDVDRMNFLIRETFIKLHSEPILEDLEEEFSMLLGAHGVANKENGSGTESEHLGGGGGGRRVLPKLPAKSSLELERCRESAYFFD